jgi:hypothetical protein
MCNLSNLTHTSQQVMVENQDSGSLGAASSLCRCQYLITLKQQSSTSLTYTDEVATQIPTEESNFETPDFQLYVSLCTLATVATTK